MDAKYSCTKCFHPLHERDAVECFGVLYHRKCAPKNVRARPVRTDKPPQK